MNLLFVCNQGKHRSRTAAEMFDGRARGIYDNVVEQEDFEWAETVIVMEDHQREEIAKRFPKAYLLSRILTLGIPDVYSYGDSRLKEILKEKVSASIPEAAVQHRASA